MNSFLSCLVCFNGCIYVQNTILNKCSLFPWPAHTFAEHYGYRQGQEMGSNKSSFKIVLLPQNYELQGLVNFIAKSIALYYNKFSFLSKLTVFRANTQQQ